MIIILKLVAAELTESFDTTKLPTATLDYLFEYGLKQSISDAYASVTKRHTRTPRRGGRRGKNSPPSAWRNCGPATFPEPRTSRRPLTRRWPSPE